MHGTFLLSESTDSIRLSMWNAYSKGVSYLIVGGNLGFNLVQIAFECLQCVLHAVKVVDSLWRLDQNLLDLLKLRDEAMVGFIPLVLQRI